METVRGSTRTRLSRDQALADVAAPRFDADLCGGLIRLHVLHHASDGDLYGNWMIKELRHHGYEISPGTLYPMLHSLERRGYLQSRQEVQAGRVRRVYGITPAGQAALSDARQKVRELFHELLEEPTCRSRSSPKKRRRKPT